MSADTTSARAEFNSLLAPIDQVIAKLRELLIMFKAGGGSYSALGQYPGPGGGGGSQLARELTMGLPGIQNPQLRESLLRNYTQMLQGQTAQMGMVPGATRDREPYFTGGGGGLQIGYVPPLSTPRYSGVGPQVQMWMGGNKTILPVGIGSVVAPTAGMRIQAYSDYMANTQTMLAANRGYVGIPGYFSSEGAEGLGITAGGKPQLGRSPIDMSSPSAMLATSPATVKDAAAKAKPPSGHMLYGMLFQAFFGILFGGMQEYMQSAATGKPAPAGGWTMLPAAMNLLGMAVGGAAGGYMGAMAGGMVGQLAGQTITSGIAGRGPAGQAVSGYHGWFGYGGPAGRMNEHPNSWASWFQNASGDTARYNMWTAIGKLFPTVGMSSTLEDTSSLKLQLERAAGTDDPEAVAKYASGLLKPARNPFLQPYYRLGRGNVPVAQVNAAGVRAHFLEMGEDVAQDYGALGYNSRAIENIIAPMRSASAEYARAERWQEPWRGVHAAQYGMERSMGISGGAGYHAVMSDLNSSIQNLTRQLMGLGGKPGTEYASNEIRAQIAGLKTDIVQQWMTSLEMQIPAADRFIMSDTRTKLRAASTLGPGWTKYAGMLGFPEMEGSSKDTTTRGYLRKLMGEDVRAIGEYQQVYAEREAELRGWLQQGKITHADYIVGKQNAGVILQDKARPHRESLITGFGQMSTGWMDRLVGEVRNAPGHAAMTMRQFNYMRAGDAYEARFGESQPIFGGRIGVAGLPAERSGVGGRVITRSDAERGDVLTGALANVHVTINVNGGRIANETELKRQFGSLGQQTAESVIA